MGKQKFISLRESEMQKNKCFACQKELSKCARSSTEPVFKNKQTNKTTKTLIYSS